jgi:hypothetical protein
MILIIQNDSVTSGTLFSQRDAGEMESEFMPMPPVKSGNRGGV